MIIDSSAILAIIVGEPDGEILLSAIENAGFPKMSIANYLEASIRIDGMRDSIASRKLDDFVRMAEIQLRPVTVEQGRIAREAYRDFGKGSGHKAQLNFGDCFAYALAKETGEPLLFKGNDFNHTDVDRAR